MRTSSKSCRFVADVVAILLGMVATVRADSIPAAVREQLTLSPFYQKYCDAMSIAVVASEGTQDVALEEACFLIQQMLQHRPEIAKAIAKAHVRVAIMAHNEFTTDIPEHSDLTPASYWNQRARGLGATRQRPAVSCGEENLLCLKGDPYAAENIFIHEFGHVIHEVGMAGVDPTFDDRLKACYESALNEGLWKGAYAATNRSEYWAEGVQSWFDTNRENDREHNHVNTREELQDYDPRLAKLCEEVFGTATWRYVRPADRKPPSPHFAAFDRDAAPSFSWPAELISYRERFNKGEESLASKEAVLLKVRPADDPGIMKSQNGSPTSLWIQNLSEESVDVEWIDSKGQSKKYATLRPGDHHEQSTYAGHVWRVTSESGIVRNYVAESNGCQIVIRSTNDSESKPN